MSSERGQATVEWVGLVLLVALALGALVAFGPHLDGRSYGGFLARAIVCAVRGGCDDGRDQLIWAYGRRDAALVRQYAPNVVYEPGEKEIPIDYRRCRTTTCGDASTDRSLDVSQTSTGVPATAFTHVVHEGGSTFIQYWFYYPDSNTTWAASDKAYAVATHRSTWPTSSGAMSPTLPATPASTTTTGRAHHPLWREPDCGQAVAIRSARRLSTSVPRVPQSRLLFGLAG